MPKSPTTSSRPSFFKVLVGCARDGGGGRMSDERTPSSSRVVARPILHPVVFWSSGNAGQGWEDVGRRGRLSVRSTFW